MIWIKVEGAGEGETCLAAWTQVFYPGPVSVGEITKYLTGRFRGTKTPLFLKRFSVHKAAADKRAGE